MSELVISTSGSCVHFLNMRVCHHGRSGWTIQYRNFTRIHLLMRDERSFAERIIQEIGQAIRFGDKIMLNEQVAARLHVAGSIDLRQARIEDGKMVLTMAIGGYNVPVELTTQKAENGTPFAFKVIERQRRHLASVR